MISIRRQLTRELLGAVLLVLGGGLTALYFVARQAATQQFDRALQAKALAISTLTVQSGDSVRVEFNDRFMHGFEDYESLDFFQIWNADGKEIGRSESLLAGSDLMRRTGKIDRPAQWNFPLPNGRPGRGIGFQFKPKASEPRLRAGLREVQLVVASDRRELDATLWKLLAFSVGWSVLLVGVTLLVVPRVLRRGLRPLGHLGDQAAHIEAESLATRFTISELPAELQPIAQRLNDLLGRLEQSFERERRFSADLAHELRTPLAELRSMAECAIKWPDARDDSVDRETLAIARQMERIVTHILALARGEQDQLPVTPESVPLAPLIEATGKTFAARAADRFLHISFDLEPANGLADAALLRSIVTNLYENAVDYTPAGGKIHIAIRQEATARAVVSIANTTTEITAEDLPKLFHRFWRKEAARSGGQHVGLGLSLSQAFAKAMDWTLTADLDAHRRLVFTLSGPASSGAASTPSSMIIKAR